MSQRQMLTIKKKEKLVLMLFTLPSLIKFVIRLKATHALLILE